MAHSGTEEKTGERLIRLSVPDMDCPVEEGEIRAELEKISGIRSIAADTARRTLEVRTASVPDEDILAALDRAGHPGKILPVSPESSSEQIVILVPEMDCAVEAGEIEEALSAHPEIPDGVFDTRRRTITFPVARDRAPEILDVIRGTGYSAQLALRKSSDPVKTSIPWKKLGTALVLAFAAELIPDFAPTGGPALTVFGHGFSAPDLIGLLLAVISVALSGVSTFRRGLISFFHFKFNMSALMALAVIGAILTGNWAEGAMVMALFEISEGIEQLCLEKSRSVVKSLLSIVPKTAEVKRGAGWETVPVESVAIGDQIRVKAGERISLDGRVIKGDSSADESMITGEPVPASKHPGSDVYAGTVNTTGMLEIRVTAPSSDTLAARIIASVEDAEQKKAPTQRFVDRFALYYTPIVFAAAILTATLPPLFAGAPWMEWIYKGLVLLVIGCPCALVISTPVTIISSLACAAREGIVIKGGKYLEEGRLLKNVALDKTGTITTGRPVCTDVIPVSPKLSEAAALERASALSQLSDHPVSTAITHAARKAKSLGSPAEDLKAIPGAGVEAKVGRAVLKLVSPAAVKGGSPAYQAAVRKLESEGKTVSVLADLFGPVAVFGVADTVKSGVRESIADLKAAGMTPWMLTGDNERAASAIAASVGIDHAEARLLPQQKLEKIGSLQKDGLTAMVGDGINDAPALAASDIGFAMGVKGTDTAIEAASVILMDDNIGKIAFFKRLAAKTYRFLVANIAFAIAVKIVFAVLDFAGLATMWMAVFADTGVTLIVVANGMRLLRAAPGIHSDMESERPETRTEKVAEDSPLSAAA